jgi:hypothetical protein
VGVAKSGTTYLQKVLFDNRSLLEQHGVRYPATRRDEHFLASMDLRASGFEGHTYPAATGAWDRVVRSANAFTGSVVISHETFARTPAHLVSTAVESFDGEVHVVVTARDLGRQIPAVWQERVKNRHTDTYHEFLERVLRSPQGRRRRGGFWVPQDLGALVARWAAVVGPDRVTAVTVPPPGADSLELWRRFATAVELPDIGYTFPEAGSNPSLGIVEAELLRRVNPMFEELTWPEYEHRVKLRFAQGALAQAASSPRITVPKEFHDEVRAVAESVTDDLRRSGCRVVGDLADLRPVLGPGPWPAPDDATDGELLDVSLRLLATYAGRAPDRGRGSVRTPRRVPDRVARVVRRVRGRG